MPCAKLPAPSPPVPLPAGININPPAPFPIPDGSDLLCCKLFQFTIPPITIPLPPFILNSGTAAAINAAISGIFAYIDSLALKCPKE